MFHSKLDDSRLWHDANFYRSSPNWCANLHPEAGYTLLNHYLTLTKIENGKIVEENLQTLKHASVTDLCKHAHVIMTDAANRLFGTNNWRFKPDASIVGGYAVSTDTATEGQSISIECNLPTL
jgi:hypothetical protein